MAVRVSTRISIRWPPAEASEPTDTLVLSVGDYYVDLRVLKSDQSIDWALAGQRIVISDDPLMIRVLDLKADILQVKVKFTHPLDSHYAEDQQEAEPDVGEFTKLPNGDDLEKGVMAAPHLDGKVMPYEEVWRELVHSLDSPGNSSGNQSSWILESVDQSKRAEESPVIKSYYAKAGRFFLALRQTKSSNPSALRFSAIRQDWDLDRLEWITKYRIGDVDGMFVLDNELGGIRGLEVGDKITVGPHKEACIVRSVGAQ